MPSRDPKEPTFTASATLRIMGESLEPALVSTNLGITPSWSHEAGERIVGSTGKKYGHYSDGVWGLESVLDEAVPIVNHIESLLARVRDHTHVLKEIIAMGCRIDIITGYHFSGGNGGFDLPSQLLADAARLGIDLGFDIYCADEHVISEDSSEP